MGILSTPRCKMCNLYEQTTQHLFFSCTVVRNFWLKFTEWVSINYGVITTITLKDIIFGRHNDDTELNKLILLAKMFIFNYKTFEKELNFSLFEPFAMLNLNIVVNI